MRLTALLSIFLFYSSVLSGRVGDDPDTTVHSTTTLHSTVTVGHYNGPTSRPWAFPLAGGGPKWQWRGSHGFGSSNHAVGVRQRDGSSHDHDGEHKVVEIQDFEAQPVSNAARSNYRPAPFFGLLTSLVKTTFGASVPDANSCSEGDEVANPAARADLVKRSEHVTRKYHHHHHNNTAISLRPHRMFSMLAPWLSVGTASRHMPDPRTENGGLKVKNREVADHEASENGHYVGQNDHAVKGVVDVPCIKVERDVDAEQSKNANEALGLGSALVSAWEKAKEIWS
ncbi:hypothetical protein PV10_01585 [Exophiala mesophila]|uniref:Uncharacterized protein n=1 Tax=Exophiala mesophila TaxID=212818 RepID=A0A0D1X7P4_EXOME|nr:uncharacterized protein PV10_01585 [Exophiala mesophila]KIV97885.1 hypothetical protein PV10_01585 [Exophiala mesophila]